jgi:hypothetical protein
MKPKPQQIDPQLLADAEAALGRYIAGQRKRGSAVEVQKPLYHEGLTNIRCVLLIDGKPNRMYFRQALGRWVKATS